MARGRSAFFAGPFLFLPEVSWVYKKHLACCLWIPMVALRPLFSLALLVVALPAMALESGGRLVPGGAPATQGATEPFEAGLGRTFLPAQTIGGYAVGVVAEPWHGVTALPFSHGHGPLAVGGYVSYGLNTETLLSSSLRSDGSRTSADLTAAYHWGADSTAAVSLGARWDRPPTGFSLNPAQPQSLTLAPSDAFGSRHSDVNVGVSLTHQMTPSLSFGGVAQASQATDGGDGPGVMFGAGMGLRF